MHYETLQVPLSASAELIKKQYRKLSLQWHPDRKGGDESKFKQLTAAYEILSNDRAKRMYDMEQPILIQPVQSGQPRQQSVEITLDQAYTGCAVPFEMDGETFYVEIPAGIDNNEVVVTQAAVRIRVTVRNTTALVRTGLDLTYTHCITLKDALCGSIFEIQYLEGQALRLSTIGTIITPNYRKILPLKGMRRDKNCGSLTIAFKIEFPTLTVEQLSAIEKIL